VVWIPRNARSPVARALQPANRAARAIASVRSSTLERTSALPRLRSPGAGIARDRISWERSCGSSWCWSSLWRRLACTVGRPERCPRRRRAVAPASGGRVAEVCPTAAAGSGCSSALVVTASRPLRSSDRRSPGDRVRGEPAARCHVKAAAWLRRQPPAVHLRTVRAMQPSATRAKTAEHVA
jgi:hypothetical protein